MHIHNWALISPVGFPALFADLDGKACASSVQGGVNRGGARASIPAGQTRALSLESRAQGAAPLGSGVGGMRGALWYAVGHSHAAQSPVAEGAG